MCEVEKLPNEFATETIADTCDHPLLCCLRVSIMSFSVFIFMNCNLIIAFNKSDDKKRQHTTAYIFNTLEFWVYAETYVYNTYCDLLTDFNKPLIFWQCISVW